MDRQTALVLTLFFFLLFVGLLYFGVRATLWSSVALGTLVALILLNVFYPVTQTAVEGADLTLALYALFQIGGILLLVAYVLQRSLTDVRPCVR